MANPTTNYGWPMPTSADLVTDLPADFALFGQPVDTSLKALNPETTLGDIAYRSATSNTNTRLGIGTNGQVLAVSGGVPAWTTTADVTPLTTKGDLFTFDTADARLGVGTNGQTLVADSTASTGLKWATPASGSSFVGVSVYGGTLSIPNNTSTAVVFNGENFDTSAFHDNVTNNTRITIPSGKTGYYQVNLASGTFDVSSTGTFYFQIKKNGSDIMETPANKFFSGAYMGQGYAWIFYLTAADYIQLYANQSSGGALNLYSNQANSNFSFSYLGA